MMQKTNKQNPQRGQEKEDPITITEIEQIARRQLPRNVWDYYACGSDDQYALRRNVDVFNSLYICPRVLRNVRFIDTRTSIFGTEYPLPLGVAPSAMQKLVGGEGEMDVARAAQKFGVNITLSSQSTTSLEDVISTKPAATTGGPQFWFQIYLTEDLEKSVPLIRRAEAAGYEALVLTVDTPVLGNRINERKVPLALPPHLRLANIESGDTSPKVRKPTFNRLLMDSRTAAQANAVLASAGGSVHSSSLTWETTIPFLRRVSNLKIILKGIMTPEDAELAVRHGADAIVVSNHGGRQLDSVASALDVLPDIAKLADGRIPVIMDGGVRKGSDIFKALALGADFVCIGRPVLWGLSYDGQNGVETVLHILERELSRTMALAGVATVADIKGTALHVINKGGFGVSRL